MEQISDYQANAIKTIYGHDTYIERDPNVTNDEALDFYRKNMSFNHSVEIPDKIKTMCENHAVSKYSLPIQNSDDRQRLDINSPKITYIGINQDIIQETKHCYKLLSEKEINWENAYLPGLDVDGVDLNHVEYKVFTLDETTGTIKMDSSDPVSFNCDNNLPNTVYNTYDLIKIIDYLLLRIKALYFMLDKIHDQRSTMQSYNSLNGNDNEND